MINHFLYRVIDIHVVLSNEGVFLDSGRSRRHESADECKSMAVGDILVIFC